MASETGPSEPAAGTPRQPRAPRRRRRRRVAAVLAVVTCAVAAGVWGLPPPGIPVPAPIPAGAADAVVVVAPRYHASRIHRFWMGDGYRELWETPIRAPVVDLGGFAGGLTPVRRGGGRQTRSLRLRGADGRDYVFRSLDKDQARTLPLLGRATFGRVRQDQVSALHPGAVLVAAGLEDAAGVPNATPRLGVIPNVPALGEFRAAFGALPGTLQLRPGRQFTGATRLADTDELWPALRRATGDRVDRRAYLAVRLMDIYLGDWDRHGGQLTWARVERRGAGTWIPIPHDRDYAFADYRGVLPGLARRVDPKIVRFDAEYRDLGGLLVKSRVLDTRLLCGLPAATWDSAAAAMARALTDRAISAAIGRMPPEYVARSAPLAATLRARRDRLPAAARRFRARLHADGRCARGAFTG
ncbi:MAG TPA: hypothetical protein VFJ16_31000 [Longimicrobium sp.]|nr:hypothetical protein [Longimicrobium sp.]